MDMDKHKAESDYTLTHFFLAQAYTHMGDKELASKHCAITTKRQVEIN